MSKVIVTGGGSQLAKTIKLKIKNSNDKFFFFSKEGLNIKNKKGVIKIIESVKPDYIINTAALTNLEIIELNNREANIINGEAPFFLAKNAKKYNYTLIHISTDYVFNGKKRNYYKPDDKRNALNKYGYSKYLAEQRILNNLKSNSIIIRVSWLYSSFSNNFFSSIKSKILNSENLFMVSDMYSHPTSTNNLSNFILHLISNKIVANDNIELLHFRDYGKPISPFQFANLIMQSIIKNNNLKNKITPIPYCKYKTKVVRPYFSAMNIRKTIMKYKFKPNNWKTEIKNLIINKIK